MLRKLLSFSCLILLCLIFGCRSGRLAKESALALNAERRSFDSNAGGFILPSDAELKNDREAFKANVRRYHTANKDWEDKAERNSRLFKIVGTGVALVGGIVGLALNNDVAGYTSLAAAANTGIMAVFNVERDLPVSGACVSYLEGEIRYWDIQVNPMDEKEYVAYLTRKNIVLDSLKAKKCKGF